MAHTLLLVDDSDTIRSVIKVYLMGYPFTFLEAPNSDKALETLGKHKVDLVLADVNMPGSLNGIDLVAAMRNHARAELRTMPVVLVSGEKGEGVRAKGKAAGANDFVPKPIVGVTLRECVTRLLGITPPTSPTPRPT